MASGLPLVDRLKEQFSVTSYADYQRNMAKKRVVSELSKLIINQPVETDSDSSSNLFKILVRRFTSQLSRTEKDPTVCDTAARKLAKFVETVMKEAYFTQKYRKRTSSIRSHSAKPSSRDSLTSQFRSHDFQSRNSDGRDSALERETIIKGLGFQDSSTHLTVEKVPRSFARNVPKCGPLYTANLGGRKVFVQEVKEGESKKALISRVNSEIADPSRESSSWMVDLANKTKDWIKWLDDKASLVEQKSSQNAQHSSDDSCLEATNRSTDCRPTTEKSRNDFHVAPAASNSNFMFSSSLRQIQRPPGSVSKMRKRQEKKLKKNGGVASKMSAAVAGDCQIPKNSDTSVDSDFDPSEFEIIAKQNFPEEPTASPPIREKDSLSKKREKILRKKKLRREIIEAKRAVQGAKNDSTNTPGNDSNNLLPRSKKVSKIVGNNVSMPSAVDTKKSKKKDEKLKCSPVQGNKSSKKRRIADIFEEAEMCIEEAVPKKIEKIHQQLMKGRKSADAKKEKRKPKKERPDYEDLSFKKSRVEVDSALLETTGEGISSGLTAAQKVLEKVGKVAIPSNAQSSRQGTKLPDIDPNKFIPVKTQKLKTALQEFEEGGDSESEEEEEQHRMNLMEAFADDDIADEFLKEKEEAEEESKPKTVDLRLPGWGSWGGIGIEPRKNNRWNKKVLKFPGVARKDQAKKRVIIHDELPAGFKKQQVDDLPSEYPSVAAYEASIRAPIGTTWVPQLAHNALVAAPVATKMGAIIQPLDESHLIKENAADEAQKKLNDSIKPGRRFKHKHTKPGKAGDHARSPELSKRIRKEKLFKKQRA